MMPAMCDGVPVGTLLGLLEESALKRRYCKILINQTTRNIHVPVQILFSFCCRCIMSNLFPLIASLKKTQCNYDESAAHHI